MSSKKGQELLKLFLVLLLGIGFVVSMAILGYYFGQQRQSGQSGNVQVGVRRKIERKTTSIPSPAQDQVEDWYELTTQSLYAEAGSTDGWFSLLYPQGCAFDPLLEKIECEDDDYRLVIYPKTGGRGAEVFSQEELKLGEKLWQKTFFENGFERSVTYAYSRDYDQEDRMSYLIQVDYQKYSSEAETLIEEVVGSFHELTSQEVENCYCGEMDLIQARKAAGRGECSGSALTGNFQCNRETGTWWLGLETDKLGCSPACVDDIESGESEINWRCTGLLPSR